MNYCCSQCDFTAGFESVLTMHRQLHHSQNRADGDVFTEAKTRPVKGKAQTLPRSGLSAFSSLKDYKATKLLCQTASATKLFGKLRARLSRPKVLPHPDEFSDSLVNDYSIPSDCTSKVMKDSPQFSSCSAAMLNPMIQEHNDTFSCHLCSFDADRITVLDRHLLNDHKIGLENLLKLVMAKTKDGLSEDQPAEIFGIRQSYYRPPDEIIEEGDFVIENVTPKIKVLKHCATNTETSPDFKSNFKMITKELEEISKVSVDRCSKEDLLAKMQTLKGYMSKFADSSETLKNVLAKELDSKHSVRATRTRDDSFSDFGKSDETPREWERPHSDKSECNRSRQADIDRPDKSNFVAESFYF